MGLTLTTSVEARKQQVLRFTKQLLYDASMSALKVAIDAVGSQAALAGLIGVKQQHVWNWLNRGNAVPPEHCAAIEHATEGKVTRRDLRPEDWERIWPELVCAEHPGPAIEQAAPADRRETERRVVPAAESCGAVELGAINAPIEYRAGEQRKEVRDAA